MKNLKIGFIGQGFIGKNMADDFAERGYDIVRYAHSPEYAVNKDKIAECDVVFIAVPTPTTPEGFDDSILRSVVPLVGRGKVAVIKSTIVPGTTESIQKENGNIFVLHSPEFLREATAEEDTRHPERNIVGMPVDNEEYKERAASVHAVLPPAPYSATVRSAESELIKYVGNNFLYTKVVFMNLMYDLSEKLGADWTKVAEAVSADSRIGKSHMMPVHTSGHASKAGRGAGGHCFPKDFEALFREYKRVMNDEKGTKVLETLRDKNNQLLVESEKDLDLLEGIYGDIPTS
ncbi:hypothetical protein KW785_03715 [Candidatus Parcubacteria bacterium]|nr:hypothetical protein [Candidatus Parcubacteria bacterium]